MTLTVVYQSNTGSMNKRHVTPSQSLNTEFEINANSNGQRLGSRVSAGLWDGRLGLYGIIA